MATMRIVILLLGIFIFMAADISVNNGASFRYLAALVRTSGVL